MFNSKYAIHLDFHFQHQTAQFQNAIYIIIYIELRFSNFLKEEKGSQPENVL
jgi:hypothetical protein